MINRILDNSNIWKNPSSNQSKFLYIIGDTFDFSSDPGRNF